MKILKKDISEIKENPNNPRIIKQNKFNDLVKSIKNFPEMLEVRPLVIDENNIVLGGNMRLKALRKAGIKEVPVEIVKNWTEKQKKEFIIKDNVGFGEWDFEMLANDWSNYNLSDWGLDIPNFEPNLIDKEYDLENEAWFLNIEFENEKEANKWYELLKKENLNIKIIQ
jgi:hypothetical protein